MKLIIKNIKQVVHDLIIPDEKNNMSIKELKEEIQKSFGFEASGLKLLFNGIVLKDEKNLSDYKIVDNSNIIMMATKGHIINQNQSNETNKENKKENEKNEDKNNNNNKQKTEEKKKNEKDYSKEINQLMEMGFEKEKCQKALKITKGNVQMAIELIYSGLPEEEIPDDYDDNDLFDNQNDYDNPYENYDNNEDDNNDDDNNNNDQTTLQKLASVIKVLCNNEPNILTEILGTIQESAPEYFDLIQENEEEFKNLIKEPINENDLRNFREFQNENDIFDNISGSNNNNNNDDINITKEEMDVVKRLQEFGNCSEIDAYQAYVACEKNENLAINFILENKFGHDSMNIDGKNFYNFLYFYIYSFKK